LRTICEADDVDTPSRAATSAFDTASSESHSARLKMTFR